MCPRTKTKVATQERDKVAKENTKCKSKIKGQLKHGKLKTKTYHEGTGNRQEQEHEHEHEHEHEQEHEADRFNEQTRATFPRFDCS